MNYYTTKLAAEAPGLSKSQVDKLCANRKIRYTMHGRDRAIAESEVKRYLKERTQGRPRKIKPGHEAETADRYI